MKSSNYMTRSTFERLRKRFLYLTTEKSRSMKLALKDAKSGGSGMHDNAGYDNALMQERMLGKEIEALSQKLQNVSLIDKPKIDTDYVVLGTKVTISRHRLGINDITEYVILGPDDVDISKNIISFLSPIGKTLLGKRVGEEFSINVPAGEIKIKILKISIFLFT